MPDCYPAGLFKEGDLVRLRRPSAQNLFDNPRGVLEVTAVHYFRKYEPPTYALMEGGTSMAVVPFRDADLVHARSRKN